MVGGDNWMIRAALAAFVALGLLSPSTGHADGGKSHASVASQAVNRTLSRSGIRGARVSTTVSRLTARRRGDQVDVRCEVRILISKSGRRIGPRHTATVSGRGHVTVSAGSKTATRLAKRSCVRDVARATARRRAAPFLASTSRR